MSRSSTFELLFTIVGMRYYASTQMFASFAGTLIYIYRLVFHSGFPIIILVEGLRGVEGVEQ